MLNCINGDPKYLNHRAFSYFTGIKESIECKNFPYITSDVSVVDSLALRLNPNYFLSGGKLLQDEVLGINKGDIGLVLSQTLYILERIASLEQRDAKRMEIQLLHNLKVIFKNDIVTFLKKKIPQVDMEPGLKVKLLNAKGDEFLALIKECIQNKTFGREKVTLESGRVAYSIVNDAVWFRKYVDMKFAGVLTRIIGLSASLPDYMNIRNNNYLLLVLTNLVFDIGYLPTLVQSKNTWNGQTFQRVIDVPIEWTAAILQADPKAIERQERQWLLKRLMPQFQEEWLNYYYANIHVFAKKEWNDKVLSAVLYPIPDDKVILI
jgi:hypothetical protein